MPRYFFNYRRDHDVFLDDQGIAFENVEAAYVSAFNGALDMWTELLRARVDPRRCSFEVMDEDHRLLFVLPFSEVLESCKRDATAVNCIDSRALS